MGDLSAIKASVMRWRDWWTDSIRKALDRIRQIYLTKKRRWNVWGGITALATAISAYVLYMNYVQQPPYDLFQQEIIRDCESRDTNTPKGCRCLAMRMKDILGPDIYELVLLYHTHGDKGGEEMYIARHGLAKGQRVVAALRKSRKKIVSNTNAAAKECGLNNYVTR